MSRFSKKIIAATTAVAGAILTMISDTMIPETFEQAHNAGLITVFGFLAAFVLSKL